MVVLPITKTDKTLDPKPPAPASFLSDLDRQWYDIYNPDLHHGGPVGIQVITRRYTEEAVLGYATQIWDAFSQSQQK